MVALVTDIGETRSAERARLVSERMLAESQAAAHVGSFEATFGEDGVPHSLRWSDETYRIFGYEPGSVTIDYGLFVGAIHPDDRESKRAAAAAGVARGGPFEKDYRIVRPDGATRVIHSWTTVEKDAAGKPARLLGTCQDITDRKRAEDQVRQTREQLQLVVDGTPAHHRPLRLRAPTRLGKQGLRRPLRQAARGPDGAAAARDPRRKGLRRHLAAH